MSRRGGTEVPTFSQIILHNIDTRKTKLIEMKI
jgi:hypothetical protein